MEIGELAAGTDPEDAAQSTGPEASSGGSSAVEVPIAALDESSQRLAAVVIGERMQQGKIAGGTNLEHGATTSNTIRIRSAESGRAIEIPIARQHKTGHRRISVSVVKHMQRGECGRREQLSWCKA